MKQRAPVVEIGRHYVGEDEAPNIPCQGFVTSIISGIAILPNSSTTLKTGNICTYSPDGTRWDHINVIIRVPPKINTLIVTTLLTSKG